MYYITADNANNKLINIFSSAGAEESLLNAINSDLKNESLTVVANKTALAEIEKLSFNKELLENLADFLFQLKDYKYYLSYILNVFLKTKHYNNICVFINRTFVSHIGNMVYATTETQTGFAERYFDRFIEACLYCNIPQKNILPFIFYINSCKEEELSYKFVRPSLEYLKNFIVNQEASFLTFIHNEQYYLNGYSLYIYLIGERAIGKVIENYLAERFFDKEDIIKIITQNKIVFLPYLKKYIITADAKVKKEALELYLLFLEDVKTTLKDLAANIEDDKLKERIDEQINLSKNLKIKSEKEFVEFIEIYSKLKIEAGLSETYTLNFQSGTKANDAILSFIFSEFKRMSSPFVLHKYDYFKDLFTEESRNSFCRNIYNKTVFTKITPENKWAVALICAMAEHTLISELTSVINRSEILMNKPLYDFVLGCLSETNEPAVLEYIRGLYLENKNEYFYRFLELIAKNRGDTAEDYIDEVVSAHNLNENGEYNVLCNGEKLIISISDNLTVKIKNVKSGDTTRVAAGEYEDTKALNKYVLELANELRTQIDRMKTSYINNRSWAPEKFINNVAGNPILAKIANTLYWQVSQKGKARKVVKGVAETVAYVKELDSSIKTSIKLMHTCYLTGEEKIDYTVFQPFTQVREIPYVATNENFTKLSSQDFNGAIVNEIKFNSVARQNGYKMQSINKNFYCKALGEYLIKVNFDKLEANIMLGGIEFYTLNDVPIADNKYLFEQAKAVCIGDVDKKLYSIVMNEIYNACFN